MTVETRRRIVTSLRLDEENYLMIKCARDWRDYDLVYCKRVMIHWQSVGTMNNNQVIYINDNDLEVQAFILSNYIVGWRRNSIVWRLLHWNLKYFDILSVFINGIRIWSRGNNYDINFIVPMVYNYVLWVIYECCAWE